MFEISDSPIACDRARAAMLRNEAGGFVCFEGWVRDSNDGRPVQRLEYEAAPELAANEFSHIERECREQFDVLDVHCIHRVGRLDLGEVAVWIGVTAAHRDAAFRAARYVIDELKMRVPIWKKEIYLDGDSGWLENP